MHKFLFSLVITGICLTSLTACAQNSHLDKFYKKYQSAPASGSGTTGSANTSSGSSGKTSITISSDDGSLSGTHTSAPKQALSSVRSAGASKFGRVLTRPLPAGVFSFILNACFPASDGQAASGWVRKMTNLRLLILDGEKNASARQEWTDLEESLKQDQFEELLTIRKGSDRVRLLSKDAAAGMKEVAFLVAGKDGSGLFFHFRGHFTSTDMASIQSVLQSHDSQ
jgi:hypothetical protein